jgi:DNA-binding response OmpR family regulator
MLRLLRFLLVTAGYGVLEAHTDEEAIAIMKASPYPIDLLLVDVERTDTDHGALVRHARARTPAARVLYMSSLSDQELDRADLAGIAVVHKPVGASALVRRIREFLDDPGP